MLDQRTSKTPVPPADILTELEPALQQGLERHLSQATEWFPHEYVPYEEGRNYVEEPWEPTDSHLSEISRISLEVNLLTEDNLPYYHLALWETFGRDGVWGEWVRRWTAEEGRHAIVLRDYLTVTRGLDPCRARARPDGDRVARLLPRRATAGSSPIRSMGWSTRRCRSSRPGSRTATRGSTRTTR